MSRATLVRKHFLTINCGNAMSCWQTVSSAAAGKIIDHLLSRPGIRAFPCVATTQIVDDDRSALSGEQQGVFTADPTPGAGDDGDPAFQR